MHVSFCPRRVRILFLLLLLLLPLLLLVHGISWLLLLLLTSHWCYYFFWSSSSIWLCLCRVPKCRLEGPAPPPTPVRPGTPPPRQPATLSRSIINRARENGRGRVRREALWLEGRVLQLPWVWGGDCPKQAWGHTPIWELSILMLTHFLFSLLLCYLLLLLLLLLLLFLPTSSFSSSPPPSSFMSFLCSVAIIFMYSSSLE